MNASARPKSRRLVPYVTILFLAASCGSDGVRPDSNYCSRSPEAKNQILANSARAMESAASGGFSDSEYDARVIWIKKVVIVEWWPKDVEVSAWETWFDCSGKLLRLRETRPDETRSYSAE